MIRATDIAELLELAARTARGAGYWLFPDAPASSTATTPFFLPYEELAQRAAELSASLAAQVAHVTFFIESFERFALQGDNSPRDWGEIWRTVEKVTPAEWDEYKRKLNDAYLRMSKLFHENPAWNEDTMGGALSIVVHTAYHLGEIRQALCTLK